MKYLFVFLLVGLVSCGGNTSGEASEDAKEGLDNLEVYKSDLGEMSWEEAKQACANLGDGWRLPTLDELELLFQSKDNFSGFTSDSYWSSDVSHVPNDCGGIDFENGHRCSIPKHAIIGVRAVRTTK